MADQRTYPTTHNLVRLPFGNWIWPGETHFGALALPATVFTLLLSFRVARLNARAQDEDNRIFILFQNVDLMVRRDQIHGLILQHIADIGGSYSPEELRDAYRKAQACFASVSPGLDLPYHRGVQLIAPAQAAGLTEQRIWETFHS